MTENIKFNYLYRDSGNYKSWGVIIFANPDNMPISEVESRLTESLFHKELFIADQIDVPQVFMYTQDNATEDDLCFHEFESIELTGDAPSDVHKRTIKNFVAQVEAESITGWRSFNPSR